MESRFGGPQPCDWVPAFPEGCASLGRSGLCIDGDRDPRHTGRMLEYVFFNEPFREEFANFLQQRKVAFELKTDPIEDILILSTEEPEDEDLWDLLDETYEEINLRDQAKTESASADLSGAGIYIELGDGRKTLACVEPDVINRMLTVVSMEEFNQFIEVVVKSVENPDDSPICHHLDKQQKG